MKKLFSGIFLSVLVLEVSLQALSWGLHVYYSPKKAEKNAFRVLFLGESVTQGNFQDSYPNSFYQAIHRDCPKQKWQIHNAAVAGIQSDRLFALAKQEVARVQPHFVFVMGGINDNENTPTHKEKPIFLKLQKAYLWAKDFWVHQQKRYEDSPLYSTLYAQPILNQEGPQAALDFHENTLAKNPSHRFALLEKANILRNTGRARESTSLYFSIYQQEPNNPWFLWNYAQSLWQMGEQKHAKRLLEATLQKNAHSWLAKNYVDLAGLEAPAWVHKIAATHLQRISPKAKVNLDQIATFLQEQKIPFLFLAYPLRDAHTDPSYSLSLKEFFSRLVKELGYKRLFYDSFAGDFGHLTHEGNNHLGAWLAERLVEKYPSFCLKY